MSETDLVVIGGGVAGLTAATFAARYGLRTLVVDQMGTGGQILNVELIENFPGFPQGVPGFELGPLLQEQALNAGAEFVIDQVLEVTRQAKSFSVKAADNEITARAVIIAAGSTQRRLGIPGEEEYNGRGVSYCASCDGSFFSGQNVGVVGGGDAALDEAVVLTHYAARVRVFHRAPVARAQQALHEKVAQHSNIELVANAVVEEIIGSEAGMNAVRIRDLKSGERRQESIAGLFVYVGLEPNTAPFAKLVDMDGAGHITTDISMSASMPGIFAAGDIRMKSVAQLAACAGDGATAAISACRYLTGR